ncbi:DotH/IcmK family type IV secretion protein [Facilibium subflavum]|uniref:DotH/IcmK family type IV secretion protein n=1 Tax=Facilibium subflavum TaxID=2219058 RepID=UPI000E6598AD|nr:DotH/IcmK family type IV secretion protein [Facilibium subflavum]
MCKKFYYLFFCLLSCISYAKNTDVSNAAFTSLLDQSFPLKPQQIEAFKSAKASQEKAISADDSDATSRIISAQVDPAKRKHAPVVRVGVSGATVVVVTDQEGNIWPIEQYVSANSAIHVTTVKDSGSLILQSSKPYIKTNLTIVLKGLDVPVPITLISGQKTWDDMDYIRIQALSPQAKLARIGDVKTAPDYLVALLSGVPPQNAQPLSLSGSMDNNTRLWAYQGHYILLTDAILLSPEWISRANNKVVNTMHAYELPQANVLLLNNHGKTEQVTVEDKGDV